MQEAEYDSLIEFERRRESKCVKPKTLDDLDGLKQGDLLMQKNLGCIVFDYLEDDKLLFYSASVVFVGIDVLKTPNGGHISILPNGRVHFHGTAYDELFRMEPSDDPEYVRRKDYLVWLGLMKDGES